MPFGGGETLRPGKAQTTHVRTTPRKEKYFLPLANWFVPGLFNESSQ